MSTRSQELCKDILREALRTHVTVGTAESCTGGMVCAALTDIPGSSAVVLGSIVSYAVPVKEAVLGVPQTITQNESIGVVSSECAASMCEGARVVLGCDVAVSVTGIAGPGGEEPGKPVGTVWFGLCNQGKTQTLVRHFSGNREEVREQATIQALQLLLEAVS